MRLYRRLSLALLILVAAILFFQPKEIVEDPSPETEDVSHLSYSSRINDHEDISIGPYVSRQGAGARIKFPF